MSNLLTIKDAKVCPFCRSKKNLKVMSKEDFYILQSENGSALMRIECKKCEVTMRNFHLSQTNYEIRVSEVIKDWNKRGEADEQ